MNLISYLGNIETSGFYYFRKYLKKLTSDYFPQRLLAYGRSKDHNIAIISTVKQFPEDNQPISNVRFPYLDCRGVASLNGSLMSFMMKCFFTIAVELEIIWL